jgi:hypothetical protein
MIIGITGRAQHGKDSVGKRLVDEYGFTRFAFADALKSMALTLNPLIDGDLFDEAPARLADIVELFGWEKAKEYPDARRFLQVLGTEAVRDHLGEDAWVMALLKKINEAFLWTFAPDGVSSTPDGNIVITDVRFPNEAEAVKDWGGYLWRVKRIDHGMFEGDSRPFDNGVDPNHPSEAFVDHLKVDAELVAGNLVDLYARVDEEVRRIS